MSIFIDVKIIADSRSDINDRITTFALEYPRYIHAELMTHRMFSRNAQSSRAIPVERYIKRLMEHPVVPEPEDFGTNKKGMQAGEPIPQEYGEEAMQIWLKARANAIEAAQELRKLNVHKQWVNRLLEPFGTIVTLVTATYEQWEPFFNLRVHPAAEPSFQKLAGQMQQKLAVNRPRATSLHLPFITEEELVKFNIEQLWALSTARCARVSYLNHDGVRDRAADIELFMTLAFANPPHASPLEHPAVATAGKHNNFLGWRSVRSLMGEDGVSEKIRKACEEFKDYE